MGHALLIALLAASGLWLPRQVAAADDADSTPEAPSESVDPDTLIVDEPQTPAARDPVDDINKLLRAEFSILEALQELEMNIARRTGELERLQSQETVVEGDLAETTGHFEQLTASLDGARALVGKRLRAMIQLKRTEPYQVLFTSASYATFLRRTRALDVLLDVDRARIESYREQLAAWRLARADLERRRNNLERTRQTIANRLQELTWDKQEKQALLEGTQERRAFAEKVSDEIQSVDQELAEKVETLKTEGHDRLWFEENKGKLVGPIWNSRVIGRFGIRKHPKFGTRTMHRGLNIVPDDWDGEHDIKVRAIYWGYVAWTGWLRGLGKVVILDHTRGYMSLYAHLDRYTVAVGDKIKSGRSIGYMGDTGSLNGPQLYLEVRKDGQAIDPLPWLR